MASPFLDNLKNAVEKGEFNSEAAKKIIEIDKLAGDKAKEIKEQVFIEKHVHDRLEELGANVSDEEAAAIDSQYEEKMAAIKREDEENKKRADLINLIDKQVSTLVEIEDLVRADVADMMSFVAELEDKFAKEFEAEDPIFGDLHLKIEQIKLKYNSIINN